MRTGILVALALCAIAFVPAAHASECDPDRCTIEINYCIDGTHGVHFFLTEGNGDPRFGSDATLTCGPP